MPRDTLGIVPGHVYLTYLTAGATRLARQNSDSQLRLLDATGKRVTNFTRVETFGDHQPTLGDVNWLKVNVDPSSREVFSYEPQIVNRDPVLVP